MKRAVVIVAVVLLIAAGSVVLQAAAQPSAQNIVAAVMRNFDGVRDYRADVTITVKGSRISINNMRMTLYYKKPNKIHVDATQGMAIVPPGNYFGNPIKEILGNGRPVYVKSERKCNRDCHLLQIAPAAGQGAQRVSVWVDKDRNLILATRSTGFAATTTQWRYEKIDGKFWLPVELKAESQMPDDHSKSKAVIKFSNYRVNKGISDRIFEEKPRK